MLWSNFAKIGRYAVETASFMPHRQYPDNEKNIGSFPKNLKQQFLKFIMFYLACLQTFCNKTHGAPLLLVKRCAF